MRSYICGVASAFFMSVSVATLAASFVTFPRTVLADEPLYSVKCGRLSSVAALRQSTANRNVRWVSQCDL